MLKKIGMTLLSLIVMSGCTTSSIKNLSQSTGSLKLAQSAQLDPLLIKGINDLAFKLQDKNPSENEFMSALSIYLALAMTSHGTANSSYDQFMDLLNPSDLDQTEWLSQLRDLQGNLNASSPIKIALSNSLWIRNDFAKQVKADFLKRNETYFGAMIATLDFDLPSAVDDINAWVKKNTNNLIEKTLDQINPSTIMFLINTIYFKGDWVNQFDKNKTFDSTFYGITEKNVKFMNQIDSFLYNETADHQSILLPYEGNKVGMLIVMGKEGQVVINSSESFKAELEALKNARITLRLPKVDIATKRILNEDLIKLGLSDPFDSAKADFSNLADADLFISQVLHKAKLLIDEEGTEAAAVTSVSVDTTSIEITDYEMNVDHPFQVFIVDLEQNLILFSGYLNDVQASE
ncbi:MAG: proteinase inhibitor I4 serpin [Erysipelotrichaceae bacterium]|nr:MAG: proteinase inhibitor I4 [Erysipelotrichaceae bacterium]TXT18127.1 MAG: proteinase inhibitor I4 serpin [Erysipelotrichaceae bacterium]